MDCRVKPVKPGNDERKTRAHILAAPIAPELLDSRPSNK
jgi:hypothetical protein